MTRIAERLATILEAERLALIDGDFERIGALMEEKQALAFALSNSREDEESLKPLQKAIRRNQELFDRALEGVRAVVARLGTVQAITKTLDTYDVRGRKFSISEPAANLLEKRA